MMPMISPPTSAPPIESSPPMTTTGETVRPPNLHARDDVQPAPGELHADAQHGAPDDAAQRRDDAGHRPGERKVAFDVDAHRLGHLLAVGDRAHGHAHAAFLEKPAEADE